MASKTWSDSVNRRIAQQRAENVKRIIMEKYWIKDEWQISIEIDLQANHPDKLGEDVSKWQWARIKLQPLSKEWENGVTAQSVVENNDVNPDEELERQLETV